MSKGSVIVNRILDRAKRGFFFEPAVSVTMGIYRAKRLPFLDFFSAVFPGEQYVVKVHVASQDATGQVTISTQEFWCDSVDEVVKHVLWERTRRLGEGVCVINDFVAKDGERSPFDHLS